MVKHVRPEEALANLIVKQGRGVRDAQRATGTEKARTTEVAQQAAADSTFAKELAEQLETELGPLPGQVQDALDEAAAALAAAGLAQSAAADAVADAQQALADAAQAIADADAAATAAADAQTAADGKSTVVRSASAATGSGSYKQGDQWWQFSGANIVGLWLHSGSAWVSQTLTNAIIATLDAGKITTGTLAADRIGALSITTAKLAADAITTEKIAALAVTAAELAADSVIAVKIAANAVTTAKLNAGAVTTAKLDALAVTAEKIAAGAIIADKIAAGAITTAKLAADAIDGMTITGALIRTAPSGQRLQMDTGGLRAFDAGNNQTFLLQSDGLGAAFSLGANGVAYLSGQATGALWELRGKSGTGQGKALTYAYEKSARFEAQSGSQWISVEADTDNNRAALRVAPGSDLLIQNTGGTINVAAGALTLNQRPVPFAEAAGVVAQQSVASTASLAVSVTFPAGRFTQPPMVVPGKWGNARDTNVGVDNVTTSGCTIRLESNSTVTRTIGAYWHAIQMTSGSGAG